MTTRAALMPRVSSEMQAADERLSKAAQRREMRAYCERQGWQVVAEYEAETFESGWTHDISKRPVLSSALADAEAGKYDVLLVHESSRFARNVELAQMVRRRLRAAGVRLVDIGAPGIDDRTAEGKMFITVQDGMNEYWSDKISEHTKKAKREAFERGLHLGDPPFGYRRVTPSLPLEQVPNEIEAIRDGYRDYITGATYTEIAAKWNAAGLKPRSKQGHTRFTVPAMQTIFENDFYAGYIWHKSQRRVGAHEPAISEETWQAAQSRVRRQPGRMRTLRLLSGIATCMACEGPVWVTSHGRSTSRAYYYREASHERGRSCANERTMWRASAVEEEIDRIIAAMNRGRAWYERVDRDARRLPVVDSRELRERLQAEQARVTTAYLEEAISEREWRARKEDIKTRLARLPGEQPARVLFAGERLTSMGQAWGIMSVEARREACRIVFERVLVDTRAHRVAVTPWNDFEPAFAARRAEVCGLGPPGFEPVPLTSMYSAADLGAA